MSQQTKLIQKRYDRIAPYFDRLEGMMEKMMFGDLRTRIWEQVSGDNILEVGVGTGKNFAYYPKGKILQAIDFSPVMLQQAKKKREQLKLSVDLKQMDVEALAYPDNSFDCIVATFLFCSVPHPKQGFLELKRVCKPNGRIVLLEHVLSSNSFIASIMHLLNPIVVRLFGANINRKTVQTIQQCGFKSVSVLPASSHLVKLIKIDC